jgi:predicted tellurium resistance membrane protein TerC
MLGLEASVTRYGERNFYLMLYRILFFLPCFALGFLYKRILEKYDRIPTALYLFLLLTGMAVIFARYPHIGINPAWLDFSDVPVVIIYLIVFIPILFWAKISHILETVIKNSPTLRYIADHTFDIMMHQFLGLMLAKKLLSGFGTFNPTAFKTEIWYYHFPWNEVLVTPFYFTITLVISLLTGFTNRKLYLIIKQRFVTNRQQANGSVL